MNQSDAALQNPIIRRDASPSPAPPSRAAPEKKESGGEGPDPPAGPPRIETPTNTGTSDTPSSGAIWVPPAHSPLPPM